MTFQLTILGCNSAIPTINRKPTAQLLNVAERFFLIDCGEGTQLQLRKYKIKMQNIHHIFISHLHGDHYFGLIGFISTMHLLGREKELHIYAPSKLKEIIYIQLEASGTELRFPLFFHEFGFYESEHLLESSDLNVFTIPLKHSIPCCGFLFKEKPKKRRIIKDKIDQYHIPVDQLSSIKDGEDYILNDGRVIPNVELTSEPQISRSFAFCSDTAYCESIISQIRGVDMLYHEATYLDELKDRAHKTMHSTAKEAAIIAKKSKVKKLIIGHYSQRYFDLNPLLKEAQSVFKDSFLAIEGEKFSIK